MTEGNQRTMIKRKTQTIIAGIMILAMFAGMVRPAAVFAQEATSTPDAATPNTVTAADPLAVSVDNGDVLLRWSAGDVTAAALDGAPTVRYGGYDLPMRLVTVKGGGAPVLEEVDAVDWNGELTRAEALAPKAIDWEDIPFILTPDEPEAVPDAPVFVYSRGRVRGQEIQVIALSPIYRENGTLRYATNLQARIAAATPVDSLVTVMNDMSVRPAAAEVASTIGYTGSLAPTNAAATTPSVKFVVTQRGIQEVSGQQIAAAGIATPVNISSLKVTYKDQVVALQVLDRNNDGKLDNNDTLRFYAPGAGDYWNNHEVYWLTANGGGALMDERTVTPGDAPLRTTAMETGVWRNNKVYVSQYPGPDSDHWYAQDMKIDPGAQGQTEDYPTLTMQLDLALPAASGTPSIFTPQLLTYIKGEYEVQLTLDGTTKTVTRDTTKDAVAVSDWQPEASVNGTSNSVKLTLIPGDTAGGMLVDSLAWAQPVSLDLRNAGAIFQGVDGTWRYKLSNLPGGYVLYDITDPLAPVHLRGMSDLTFEDGPDARTYLVSYLDSTLFVPQVVGHSPLSFNASKQVDAVYIAPAGYIDALAPLLEHRRNQGYTVEAIDVQTLYDAWGYGMVEPDAIRDFLRWAAVEWGIESAVLVSDGTRDPFNYEEKESVINDIPPYLRTSYLDQNGYERFIDPWLGQNGCDTCYAQLDGDDPLNNEYETPGKGFMPDIWLGRFPVKSADEVATVVAKIVRYETIQAASVYWTRTAAFLADNYVRQDGSTDSAGDFVKYTEDAIALMHAGIRIARLYFDPLHNGDESWREDDAVAMNERAVALLNSGPGLVTYNGHGNWWQWATTDSEASTPYIFYLYDVDKLTNRNQLFIGLSMTCYTSQFFQPANSGTTLDERMFLHPNGGAAAVWGPSGLSVLHGHDDLQYGFHKLLAAKEPGTAKLGELVQAGYYENFSPSPERNKLYACCEDVRRTFLLFGDPLTTVRLLPDMSVYLPMVTSN